MSNHQWNEEELRGQVERTGVPGIWKEDKKNLIFSIDSTPTLTWDKTAKTIKIEGSQIWELKFLKSSLDSIDTSMSNLEIWNTPDKILDKLYLGSHAAAQNIECLNMRGVTHILTVASGLSQDFPEQFQYKRIDALDYPGQNLYQHFNECIEFIDQGRKNGGVLVHCAAGISRSSTIVVAYLMHHWGVSFVTALNFVLERRWVCPNDGFVSQLKKWERDLKSKNSSEFSS